MAGVVHHKNFILLIKGTLGNLQQKNRAMPDCLHKWGKLDSDCQGNPNQETFFRKTV